MEWEEVEKTLIRLLGPNYFNYPQCVEWNIKIMKFCEQQTRKSKELERVNDNE